MVQNSSYSDAMVRGRAAAERATDTLNAVMAIVEPVVECNRVQVLNGRISMASAANADRSVGDVLTETREQVRVLLDR